MKAVGLYRYLPIDDPEALLDVEIAQPVATGRDLLVKVDAISVNPVDYKVRSPKPAVETAPSPSGRVKLIRSMRAAVRSEVSTVMGRL